MNDFKWKHFPGEIILGCVRWYSKYGSSYRDLEEIMIERGVEIGFLPYRGMGKHGHIEKSGCLLLTFPIHAIKGVKGQQVYTGLR